MTNDSLFRKNVRKILLYFLLAIGLAGLISYYYYLVPGYVKAPHLSGSLTQRTVNHFGYTRTFYLYLPEYLSDNPDLILVLHGSGGTGLEIREQMSYEFDLIAEQGDAVIVYPDGFENHWNGCRASAAYAANLRKVDDVGFFRKLEKQLAKSLQLKFDDIFVVGLSNGGHMAYRLALEAPDWLTAIGAIAANLPAPNNMDCQDMEVPVAVLMMNGTEDPVNPYNGGEVSSMGFGESRGEVLATWETADYWLARCGLDGEPEVKEYSDRRTKDGSRVFLSLWQGPGKWPVALYTVEGGGHTIPHPGGAVPRVLGRTNRDLNGPREIWNFFQMVGELEYEKGKPGS